MLYLIFITVFIIVGVIAAQKKWKIRYKISAIVIAAIVYDIIKMFAI